MNTQEVLSFDRIYKTYPNALHQLSVLLRTADVNIFYAGLASLNLWRWREK